jgi:hypothetical protein
MTVERNPTVFISYSHDNKTHQDRVLALSNKLRTEGIDCQLDQYEESPSEGWPRWMQKMIKSTDFVLLVCTPTYYKRVMGVEEEGKGHGVRWEGNLIYQEIYDSGTENHRFIPVIFNDGSHSSVPDPIRGATVYNIDDVADYDKVYWRLRGVKITKPELGKLRKLEPKPRRTIFVSGLIDTTLWDKAKWKGTAYMFDYDDAEPPYIALIFDNPKYGKLIFEQLRDLIGENDPNDELRLSIVEGEAPNQAQGYFVHVSQNLHNVMHRVTREHVDVKIEFLIGATRIHRMPTINFENLNQFKQRYREFGSYIIAPGELLEHPEKGRGFMVHKQLGIHKKQVFLRKFEDIKEKEDYDAILKDKDVEKWLF